MRDTIIWLTIKEFLRANTDKRILLVTNDAKAYLDDEKEDLHPSLKRELVEEAIPQDSVLVRRNLDRVKSDFVSSILSDAEWVSIAIKNSAAIEFSDQDDTIALMAQDWMFEHSYIFEDPYVTSDHDSVEFEGLEGVLLDDVEETLDLGWGQVSVASVWTGEADLVGSLGGQVEESLRAVVWFRVGSIVRVQGGQLSVQSHEIVDAQIEEVIEVASNPYRRHQRVSKQMLEQLGLA